MTRHRADRVLERPLGGYGERMLLSAPLLVEVPNGLDFRHAALTEPMAVGLHAVNRSEHHARRRRAGARLRAGRLAVIAALKVKGIDHDRRRRPLARPPGAGHHHGRPRGRRPAVEPAFDAWARVGGAGRSWCSRPSACPASSTRRCSRRRPAAASWSSGVCMEPDTITPFFGIGKELDVHFCLGYDPMEFTESLRCIAEGEIDVAPMITGEVGLDGVPGAFDDLGNPEEHCKILATTSGATSSSARPGGCSASGRTARCRWPTWRRRLAWPVALLHPTTSGPSATCTWP